MLTTIAIVVVAVIAAGLLFIVTRPDSFRLERTAVIGAPAGVVFPLINDFHHWERWSPWENLDPNMKKAFEGSAASGPGAGYYWSGNSKAGEGRMTILDSKKDQMVSIKLEFMRPFACTNQATFRLTPRDGGTHVSWVMEGKNNFMGKVFSPFMDKAVGGDFERGLANLNREVSV